MTKQQQQSKELFIASLETERAMLNALVKSKQALTQSLSRLTVEDFTLVHHQTVFRAILTLYAEGRDVDLISVTGEVKKTDPSVSPVALLKQDESFIGNALQYAELLNDFTRRRTLQALLLEASKRVVSSEKCDEIIGDVISRMMQAAVVETVKKPVTLHQVMTLSLKRLEHSLAELEAAAGKSFAGLSTGLTELDEKIGGAKPGEVIVVGARPGMGKSALLATIAIGAAKRGFPALIANAEMELVDIGTRLLAGETGISNFNLRRGNVDADDLRSVVDAAHNLAKVPVWIYDDRRWSIIKMQVRAMKRACPQLALLVVDYIGRLRFDYGPNEKRYEQLGHCMQELKDLAKDLQLVCIVAAQLKRPEDARKNAEPTLSALRESGDLEQEADIVLLLHRFDPKLHHKIMALIAKNRNGPLDYVPLRWTAGRVRFYNWEE